VTWAADDRDPPGVATSRPRRGGFENLAEEAHLIDARDGDAHLLALERRPLSPPDRRASDPSQVPAWEPFTAPAEEVARHDSTPMTPVHSQPAGGFPLGAGCGSKVSVACVCGGMATSTPAGPSREHEAEATLSEPRASGRGFRNGRRLRSSGRVSSRAGFGSGPAQAGRVQITAATRHRTAGR
jgi:hypothetical protein